MVTIMAAQVVILMAAWYAPGEDQVKQAEARQFTTVERCSGAAQKLVDTLSRRGNVVTVACGAIDVPDEQRAKVEAFEATQPVPMRPKPAQKEGLVL